MQFSSSEYELLLKLVNALHSSLDLQNALGRAVPLLEQLISVDHVALAVSRPGTLYDYQWFNNTLPEKFLGNYALIAEQDFVRNAVAKAPNTVMRDHEMLTRPKLERHIVYTHSREAGANLEHVMAVMLVHEDEWSSGLSLYRSRRRPFSDREAAIFQMFVPQLASAVRNSREHATLQRDALLDHVAEHSGVAVIWVDEELREQARTRAASAMLQRFFAPHELRRAGLPEELIGPLRHWRASQMPTKGWPRVEREGSLSSLRASYLPQESRGGFAIVLRSVGVDAELEGKLTPGLREVAGLLVRGLSNEEIAQRRGCVLATVKQQASEVYRRLGVRGRKGLIGLASGLGPDGAVGEEGAAS